MIKDLLNRLLTEQLEAFAVIETQIEQRELTLPSKLLPLASTLKKSTQNHVQALIKQVTTLQGFNTEKGPEEKDAQAFIKTFLPQANQQICSLESALSQLFNQEPVAEVELFTNSLQMNKIWPDAPELVVLQTGSTPADTALLQASEYLLRFASTLQSQRPLQWLGLLDGFAVRFVEQSPILASLKEVMPATINLECLLQQSIQLRILGPGYYSFWVTQAFIQQDSQSILQGEPLLFQALNRFGLINKELVMLHQNIERIRARYNNSKVLPLETEQMESILKAVEQVVPDKLAFTERAWLRAQLLQERLEQGVLISAVPMLSSPAQLRDDLESLTESEEGSVYAVLRQMTEIPASPREILNAGWLQQLEQTEQPVNTLLQEGFNANTWTALKQHVAALDTILLKSIEISEVHRVLSHLENDVTVTA